MTALTPPAICQSSPILGALVEALTSLPTNHGAAPIAASSAGSQTEDGSATDMPFPTPKGGPLFADSFLALAADVLDDAERTRISNENRLRQLTRTGIDADGEERGFGLDESHPDVARLAALVEMLAQIEHQATLNLNRLMRAHRLGPWVKAQKGVGEKQSARLLASIGDPYINSSTGQPRTVSQLWAYAGLHVLPASHHPNDAHGVVAGGDSYSAGGNPSQSEEPSHKRFAGVAARRQKGQRVNWSTDAKTRAYLIAESTTKRLQATCKTEDGVRHVEGCECGTWRQVYDARKAQTLGRLHGGSCVRCGPSGKPAQPGSHWSDGHRHADALRIVSKELLKGLWRESRRLHEVAA